MIWLNFERWNTAANPWFYMTRVRLQGWRWTPLVRVRWRYR